MGSASPGLSGVPPSRLLLPPDTVLRTGLEKVAVGAGAMGPERRDWSPSPPATPEQGLSTFYLSYFDMLFSEDSSWVAKGPGASTREEPPDEPEQCPVIDSQAPGGSLDLAPGGLTLEEHSLEQVQSMVVGEVLKDIETACKLLNITAAAWMKERTSLGAIHYCASTSEESWTDSEVDSSCSGQPIHLWQFLKELLLKPHSYGRFIRWLNKEKGIFKIEDSAQVARLWGIRKNRPAMNYDKLSRSIRQYYKKGIIRKPDISQRLVYQFVHPI
ncbi:SAM pointed domain-containing Ets transcription factor isoform X3 [Lagenorhynchus albirostris]|uniref:SAM pointed domain-containing Ets transcription factor isoform X3 n=1 Tax=Lagenorhynchus albirostris TaxID=27610 RepID=UPI0028ECAE00|nr:SAM pointed domain-containing Ets transcription factor isoform X3 [Lagenorhynchus albirostris]